MGRFCNVMPYILGVGCTICTIGWCMERLEDEINPEGKQERLDRIKRENRRQFLIILCCAFVLFVLYHVTRRYVV